MKFLIPVFVFTLALVAANNIYDDLMALGLELFAFMFFIERTWK